MSNQIKDTITVDLHDQIISNLPIVDPDELEDVLINAADKLTDGREPIIIEALMNTLVDFYVFTLKPDNDEKDIGFLVSTSRIRYAMLSHSGRPSSRTGPMTLRRWMSAP